MENYIDRIIDKQINALLADFCAVLVRGPKWCGKSTSASQLARSSLMLDLKKLKKYFDGIDDNAPSLFLDGDKPRLIDEWQLYPSIWDEIVAYSNRTNLRNQFILTGSRTPKPNSTNHSGTMRIARLDMTTMTLFESGESNGKISLKDLFERPEEGIGAVTSTSKKEITTAIVRGGFPSSVITPPCNVSVYGEQYVEAVCEHDIQEAAGKKLSPQTALAIMRSLARNVSELVTNRTIINDVASYGPPLSEPTFYDYYDALRKLFVIEEVPAWSPMIRSKTVIRALPKKEFFDPSVACAALGVGEDQLNKDFETRGFMFECLCGRDLKVYAGAINGKVSYYRDRLGLECDYVVHLPDGRYGLFECKCGDRHIEEGAANLNKLVELIKASNENGKARIPLPSVRAIVTDEGYAYRRKDGISIVPLACLKD